MSAIYKKELHSYFKGFIGYLFCAFVLLFAGIYTMAINFSAQYASFEYVMANMSFIYLIAIPVLTMRSVAEERRQRTDLLLYSLPIGMTKVVLGKYFALLTVLAVPCAIIGVYPLVLKTMGPVSLAASYGSLLAFFLLGAGLIAIGMFISSLTENQAISAVLCFGVMLILYFIGALSFYIPGTAKASFFAFLVLVFVLTVVFDSVVQNLIASVCACGVMAGTLVALLIVRPDVLEGAFPAFMSELSMFDVFSGFAGGLFDLSGIVYFISIAVFFVFLTIQSMEKRRWS